jgi:hypothetical protein
MPNHLVELLLPHPAISRLLLLAALLVLGGLGLAVRGGFGILLSVPLGLLGLVWLGMATNDFFLALALFHLIVGGVGLVTFRRHGRRWVGITAAALLVGTPLLGLLT